MKCWRNGSVRFEYSYILTTIPQLTVFIAGKPFKGLLHRNNNYKMIFMNFTVFFDRGLLSKKLPSVRKCFILL